MTGGKLSPLARVSWGSDRVQVRAVALVEHVHPGPPAVEPTSPAGTVSVTVNGPTAVSGPVLDTRTVQENGSPATASSSRTG